MAVDIPRTARDDATDALRALDEVAREIIRWRAHLLRVQTEPTVPVTLQARRCAAIVSTVVQEAVLHTRDAVCHAEMPVDALPV